jgi:hypothetical protein
LKVLWIRQVQVPVPIDAVSCRKVPKYFAVPLRLVSTGELEAWRV